MDNFRLSRQDFELICSHAKNLYSREHPEVKIDGEVLEENQVSCYHLIQSTIMVLNSKGLFTQLPTLEREKK